MVSTRDWTTVEQAVRCYGRARKRFRTIQRRYDHSILTWNDNLVGVAAEFWASAYYRKLGYSVKLAPRSNTPGWDFIATKRSARKKISVKAVSDEARSGRLTRVSAKKEWDVLCVVHLSDTLEPEEIGLATRASYQMALREGLVRNKDPKVSPSVLRKCGWMRRYGEVNPWPK